MRPRAKTYPLAPAKAGAQSRNNNTFALWPLDSRFRGNERMGGSKPC